MLQYDFPFVASMAYPGNSTCEIGMNETESLFHITLILLRIILTEQPESTAYRYIYFSFEKVTRMFN